MQGGARAAFAKVCKMSVAGGCLQTLMTECSHGRVSVNSELGPRPHDLFIAIKIIGGEPKLRPNPNVRSSCQDFFIDDIQCVCCEK